MTFEKHIAIVRVVGNSPDNRAVRKMLQQVGLSASYEGADVKVRVLSERGANKIDKVLIETGAYVINTFPLKRRA